jgi:deazaflavin-dependent oxidoreductase (nitroreductase family)
METAFTNPPQARSEAQPGAGVSIRLNQAKNRIRFFNRRILNPFTLSFAGRPHSPYAIIRHVGRRSGRHYDTPVVALPMGDALVLPMPYGARADWVRNTLAAPECLIAWQGQAYRVGAPQIVEPAAARPAFPGWVWSLLERSRTAEYLKLTRLSAAPENEAVYRGLVAAHPGWHAAAAAVGCVGAVAGLVMLAALLSRRLQCARCCTRPGDIAEGGL